MRAKVGLLCAVVVLAGCSEPGTPEPLTNRADNSGPTPIPLRTPRPGVSQVVEHGDRQTNMVALTFTVGHRVEPAVGILELLTSREIPATIFMSGVVFDHHETVDDAEEALRLILDRPDLFHLGQHGYAARFLGDVPLEEARTDVVRAEETLARYGVDRLTPYFSPGGGSRSPEVLEMLGSLGYDTTVLWDVDPIDWLPPEDGGPSPEELARRVLDGVQGGSIVLLHLGGWNTLPALPAIIEGLEASDLRPVTIAELLG
jgi:peptidoglycan-N-acetylglucosamine deacetylase